MLLKNDKIVLKKDFGGLKKGTTFQISEIFEDGTISFRNDSLGMGVMSFDECEKMFEKCVKREFTDWTPEKSGHEFRHNGKVVEVRLSFVSIAALNIGFKLTLSPPSCLTNGK